MRREATPTDRTVQAELVEISGIVIADTAGENVTLPRVGGKFKSLQLAKDFEESAFAPGFGAGRDVLPTQEPTHELGLAYRLDLFAQSAEGEPMNAGEESAIAEFSRWSLVASRWTENTAENGAGGLEAKKRLLDLGFRQRE